MAGWFLTGEVDGGLSGHRIFADLGFRGLEGAGWVVDVAVYDAAGFERRCKGSIARLAGDRSSPARVLRSSGGSVGCASSAAAAMRSVSKARAARRPPANAKNRKSCSAWKAPKVVFGRGQGRWPVCSIVGRGGIRVIAQDQQVERMLVNVEEAPGRRGRPGG